MEASTELRTVRSSQTCGVEVKELPFNFSVSIIDLIITISLILDICQTMVRLMVCLCKLCLSDTDKLCLVAIVTYFKIA